MLNKHLYQARRLAIRALVLCTAAVYSHTCLFAQHSIVGQPEKVQLFLKPVAQVSSNLVKLSDLVDQQQSAATEAMLKLVLSPSPALQTEQLWTRETIDALLKLKGMDPQAIHWSGANDCKLLRTADISVTPAIATNIEETGKVVQAVATTGTNITPVNLSAQSLSTSHRNAISAIQAYLRSVSDTDFDYEISVDIPAEGVAHLKSRSSILAVSGGSPPWLGNQRFTLQTKNRNEIVNIEVGAIVEMPLRVFATTRSLAKDHIVTESDLKLVVLPKSSRVDPSVCFVKIEDVVGKQLRRTLATGQAIEASHLGTPRLIDQNDEVEIQVSSMGLMVKTNAKALQGGGLNDLIVVEVLPHRSKVTARIIAPGQVSVITN